MDQIKVGKLYVYQITYQSIQETLGEQYLSKLSPDFITKC